MTVRRAEIRDSEAIVQIAMRAWPETPFPGIIPNPDHVYATARKFIADDASGAFLLVNGDNEPVGVLASSVFVHPFSMQRIAATVMWWVAPEARGYGLQLLIAAEKWAEEKGADELHLYPHTPDFKELCRLAGYHELETTFVKGLPS